jgi:hypothetical protein
MNPALLATGNAFARKASALLLAAGMLGLLSSGTAFGGKPQYVEIVISDSEGGDEVEAFAPDTAKIHITAELVDVSPGMKISCKWIAEKTKVAPQDYEIDSIALTIAPKVNLAHFALSKPSTGWPLGDYRVELSINDKLAETVRFKVGQ